jgi:hypothetical protein
VEPTRFGLTAEQVALMREVLVRAPQSVIDAAERIGAGEAVPDDDAEAVANALAAAMLDNEGYDGQELTARGREVDGIVGIVQQMSVHFYD